MADRESIQIQIHEIPVEVVHYLPLPEREEHGFRMSPRQECWRAQPVGQPRRGWWIGSSNQSSFWAAVVEAYRNYDRCKERHAERAERTKRTKAERAAVAASMKIEVGQCYALRAAGARRVVRVFDVPARGRRVWVGWQLLNGEPRIRLVSPALLSPLAGASVKGPEPRPVQRYLRQREWEAALKEHHQRRPNGSVVFNPSPEMKEWLAERRAINERFQVIPVSMPKEPVR